MQNAYQVINVIISESRKYYLGKVNKDVLMQTCLLFISPEEVVAAFCTGRMVASGDEV